MGGGLGAGCLAAHGPVTMARVEHHHWTGSVGLSSLVASRHRGHCGKVFSMFLNKELEIFLLIKTINIFFLDIYIPSVVFSC